MTLYRKLPMTVEVDGKKYRIRPWFNRILEAIEILNRPDWTDGQKFAYLKWLLITGRCKKPVAVISAIFELLLPNSSDGSPRSLDFMQDAEYIYAGFLQAYGIDLFKVQDKLHWTAFAALLGALPQDTRISEIIDVRVRPIPEPNKYNKKERDSLMRAKAKWRIRLSEQEQEKEYQKAMQKAAAKLIEMARR